MTNTNFDELKKMAGQNKIVFGTNDVLRKLKQGRIKKVLMASNVPKNVEEELRHNATIASAEVEKINLPNDEFGVIFKRSHVLLTIGILAD